MKEIIKEYHVIGNLTVILTAVITWFLIKRFFRMYKNKYGANLENMNRRMAGIIHSAYALFRVAFTIIVVIILLEVNGVNVGGLLTSLGVGTAIAGFAFQDLLKDLIMGWRISMGQYFLVGDVISFNGEDCIVEAFNLSTTRLKGIATDKIFYVCNRDISTVHRPSHMVDLDLPLSYEEDVKKIHKVLTATAEKLKKVEGVEDALYKGTQNFDDSAIIYKLRFFCDPVVRPDTWRRVIDVVQRDLLEAGIAIPYRQITISYQEIKKTENSSISGHAQ